jgi:hypothetical protein
MAEISYRRHRFPPVIINLSASITTMHAGQQQKARIYLDQQYVVEEDV